MIEIKFERTNFFTRWPCTVCGGRTEKVAVLCEGADTINGGDDVRVCETCLKAGNIDERLESHASRLAAFAAELRALKGNLKVPTYAEWEAEMARVDSEYEETAQSFVYGLSRPRARMDDTLF